MSQSIKAFMFEVTRQKQERKLEKLNAALDQAYSLKCFLILKFELNKNRLALLSKLKLKAYWPKKYFQPSVIQKFSIELIIAYFCQ